MPNETVTVTISGANPQTKQVTVFVDPNTGAGSNTFNWTGVASGLDSISGAATITALNLSSNVAQHRWGHADTPLTVTGGSGFNNNTFWTFVVIGVFPDATTTGPSQPITTGNTHFTLNWQPIPGVSFYNVYCTQSIIGSAGSATATIGLLHGTGTGNGGNNSSTEGGGGPNYSPAITSLYMDDGSFFPFRGDGSAPPATNTSLLAPVLPPPSGKLTITPQGTSSVVGGVQTLTINVSAIVYAGISYIPCYETVTGSLPLYNQVANSFLYPTYNGANVDKPTALTNAWVLSGNNASYQGRLSLVFDGTNFDLNYNGATPDNHVDTTTVTITADDIAWFLNSNKSYDVFSNSGGISLQVLINWYVKPTVASVTPNSVKSDGLSHVFSVVLLHPVSPRQQGTQFGTGNSISAHFAAVGATVSGFVPQFDGSGWLTGWNVTALVPSSGVNGSITLSATITAPTLTYLNGAGFTTGAVTYINGNIATIATHP